MALDSTPHINVSMSAAEPCATCSVVKVWTGAASDGGREKSKPDASQGD